MSRKCVDCHNKYTSWVHYSTSLCDKCRQYREMSFKRYKIVTELGKYGTTTALIA